MSYAYDAVQFTEVLGQPDTPAKRDAVVAFLKAYLIYEAKSDERDNRRKAHLTEALLYVRSTPDPRFPPLVAKLPATPVAQVVLARLAPDVARTTYGRGPDHIWARLALDPTDASAIESASQRFDPYTKLSVIKPGDAEKIAVGALALALTRDAGQIERIRPFARGEKVVGAVGKGWSSIVRAVLESEGFTV